MVPIGSESFRGISTWRKGTKCQIRTSSIFFECEPRHTPRLIFDVKACKTEMLTMAEWKTLIERRRNARLLTECWGIPCLRRIDPKLAHIVEGGPKSGHSAATKSRLRALMVPKPKVLDTVLYRILVAHVHLHPSRNLSHARERILKSACRIQTSLHPGCNQSERILVMRGNKGAGS
jgi:hypothetical protein